VQRPSGQHERLSKSERDCRAASCPKSAKPSLRVLSKACRMGPLIGHEWTRPRAVRRIDTGDHAGVRRRRVGRPRQVRGPGPRAKIADGATSTVPGGAGLA
jgi:hypothetical protein